MSPEEAAAKIVTILEGFEPEQRPNILSEVSDTYCSQCGYPQPEHGCQCWNDE